MMLTKNNQPKSKDRASHPHPIDFVVPLQLEECVHRIEHSQPTAYPDLSPFTVEIKVTRRIDQNHVLFVAKFRKSASEALLFRVEGKLSRWQGTSTKVVCKIRRNEPGIRLIEKQHSEQYILLAIAGMFLIAIATAVSFYISFALGKFNPAIPFTTMMIGNVLSQVVLVIHRKKHDLTLSRSTVQRTIIRLLQGKATNIP